MTALIGLSFAGWALSKCLDIQVNHLILRKSSQMIEAAEPCQPDGNAPVSIRRRCAQQFAVMVLLIELHFILAESMNLFFNQNGLISERKHACNFKSDAGELIRSQKASADFAERFERCAAAPVRSDRYPSRVG